MVKSRYHKGDTICREVWVYLKNDRTPTSRLRSHKIFLTSPTEGRIITDGRPVHKLGNRWIYRAR